MTGSKSWDFPLVICGMLSERLRLYLSSRRAAARDHDGTWAAADSTRRVAIIILPRLRGHPVYDDEPRTTKEEKGEGDRGRSADDHHGAGDHEQSADGQGRGATGGQGGVAVCVSAETQTDSDNGGDGGRSAADHGHDQDHEYSADGHERGAAGGQDGGGLCLAEARAARAATRGATWRPAGGCGRSAGGHEHEEKNENEANRAGASPGGDNKNANDDRLNATNHLPSGEGCGVGWKKAEKNAMGDPLG